MCIQNVAMHLHYVVMHLHYVVSVLSLLCFSVSFCSSEAFTEV